jgi:hypothetical protein
LEAQMKIRNKELEPRRYFPALFFFASARRSVFFRRLARFLALSLPLLFPISSKTHLLGPSRHVVVSTKTRTKLEAYKRHVERNRGWRLRPLEADCGECDVGGVDAS